MRGNLMIQGTMSNAGKSLLTAGLLRVLKQDGFSVAPFKSQNMALNSYITEEGLEIGRAQAMQAEAAGISPEAAMNPILLKPSSQMCSQVILNGEVVGNMSAADYFRRKKDYVPDILAAYHRLEQKYEIIVIEGAGSPAEINLKENDIVNMGFARMVDAPVLLVGDIDRGGVFAQLYGTVSLLEEEERARIKGFVMNKFRGDKALLDPGIRQLYERCPIPVLGVVPYAELDIDDEDSLAGRLYYRRQPEAVDIGVIRFPHISNFTDFNPLEQVENVSLRYISSLREMGNPDLILLPGTKNTMYDLSWMRENGIEKRIKELVTRENTLVMGICGGFQMLGRTLSDPERTEAGGSMAGMDLLPVFTVFTEKKRRSRVSGKIIMGNGSAYGQIAEADFTGYEIHMGRTECLQELEPLSEIEEADSGRKSLDGYVSGNCLGTYVHGIFTSGTFRTRLLQLLFTRKEIAWEDKNGEDYLAYKNRQYDLLADLVRENMDMEQVYRIIGI